MIQICLGQMFFCLVFGYIQLSLYIQGMLQKIIILLLLLSIGCSPTDNRTDECNVIGEWYEILGYTYEDIQYDEYDNNGNFVDFSQEPHISRIIEISKKEKYSLFELGELILEIEEDGDIYAWATAGFNNYEVTEDCTQIESTATEPVTGNTVKVRHEILHLSENIAQIDIQKIGLFELCIRLE